MWINTDAGWIKRRMFLETPLFSGGRGRFMPETEEKETMRERFKEQKEKAHLYVPFSKLMMSFLSWMLGMRFMAGDWFSFMQDGHWWSSELSSASRTPEEKRNVENIHNDMSDDWLTLITEGGAATSNDGGALNDLFTNGALNFLRQGRPLHLLKWLRQEGWELLLRILICFPAKHKNSQQTFNGHHMKNLRRNLRDGISSRWRQQGSGRRGIHFSEEGFGNPCGLQRTLLRLRFGDPEKRQNDYAFMKRTQFWNTTNPRHFKRLCSSLSFCVWNTFGIQFIKNIFSFSTNFIINIIEATDISTYTCDPLLQNGDRHLSEWGIPSLWRPSNGWSLHDEASLGPEIQQGLKLVIYIDVSCSEKFANLNYYNYYYI